MAQYSTTQAGRPSTRSVARLIAGYTAGRLSSGTVAFALLLAGRHSSGGLTLGGVAVTGYTVAVAVVAPLVGRLLDRHGARRLLPAVALGYGVGLGAVALAVSGPAWLFVTLATVTGVFLPPFGPVVRTAITRGITEEKRRSRLLSVENMSMESLALVGPLIVTACALVSPALALLLTALSALVGALTLAGVPWLPQAAGAGAARSGLLCVLRSRVGGLLLVVLTFTGALSALEVALVAYAGPQRDALAGVLLALLSAGSIVSGFLTSVWALPGAATTRFAAGLAVLTAGSLTLLLPVGTVAFMVLLTVVSLAVTPTFAAMAGALGELADDAHVSETFAWMGSANFVGIAAGTGAAGWLAQQAGTGSVLVLTSATLALSVGLVLAFAASPSGAGEAGASQHGAPGCPATEPTAVVPTAVVPAPVVPAAVVPAAASGAPAREGAAA